MHLKTKIDRGQAIDLEELADDIEDFPEVMARIVEREVARERETHPYTNRTGDAQASTTAIVLDGGDSRTVIASMDVPYAGILNARGWSRFNELMERAKAKVAKAADKLKP